MIVFAKKQDGGSVEWIKIVFVCTEPVRGFVTPWSSLLKTRWRQCGMSQDRLCLYLAVERFRDLMIVFTESKMAAMWNDIRSSLPLLSRWEVSWLHDRLFSKQDGGNVEWLKIVFACAEPLWEVAWPHDRLCSKQDGGNVEWLKSVFVCAEPLRGFVTSWSSLLKTRWRAGCFVCCGPMQRICLWCYSGHR